MWEKQVHMKYSTLRKLLKSMGQIQNRNSDGEMEYLELPLLLAVVVFTYTNVYILSRKSMEHILLSSLNISSEKPIIPSCG